MLLGLAALVLAFFFVLVLQNRRRGVAVILAWIFPGLGHLYLGLKTRGLFLGGIILALFFAGGVMCDFRNIEPLRRHDVWALAHFFAGLPAAATAFVTRHLLIEQRRPYYDIGCLYSAVAGLLNLLAMLDAFDQAEPEPAAPQVDAAKETAA
jgi:hypothetical protein